MNSHTLPLFFVYCGLAAAQESTHALSNPFTTESDRTEGARTFLSQCASCHGRDGRGGQGTPDLTAGTFRRASSDDGLFQIVAKGIPGTTMPGFALEGRQIWQVLTYVRSLSRVQTADSGRGDAKRGGAIFREQNCARCHNGLAPDLLLAGRVRSPEELRTSIIDPGADVPSSYWRLSATTRDGRVLSGFRLNEDTYTVQYLDDSGALRSVVKDTLRRYEVLRASPMPSFRDKLTPAQVNDLIAFLKSGGVQ